MDNDGEGCQGLCVKLFALCRYYPWRQGPSPAGYEATCNQSQRDSAFDFLYIGLSRDGKYQYLLLLKDDLSGYLWLVLCLIADAAPTIDALIRWIALFSVVLLWRHPLQERSCTTSAEGTQSQASFYYGELPMI
jgi:hypothetical protein